MKEFGVLSSSKHLYDAFIYELQTLGYKPYKITESVFQYSEHRYLFVHNNGYNWCDSIGDAPSFMLSYQFDEALLAARKIIGDDDTLSSNLTYDLHLKKIGEELQRAKTLFPDTFKNQHEAIAIIREEYLELEQECFKNQKNYDLEAQKKEATQLAAMCLRFLIEL